MTRTLVSEVQIRVSQTDSNNFHSITSLCDEQTKGHSCKYKYHLNGILISNSIFDSANATENVFTPGSYLLVSKTWDATFFRTAVSFLLATLCLILVTYKH